MSPPATPLVSIVIPCRNEVAFIERCVLSLVQGTYPADRIEVLVVDGMSNDGTRGLTDHLSAQYGQVRMLDNPSGRIAAALNRGIAGARGEIVIRADAHAEYPSGYVSTAVDALLQLDAAGVGGYLVTQPAAPGRTARLIASVWSSPFGLGGERSKTRSPDPRVHPATAVFGGCFRRVVFERVGLYDERFVGSEDIELYDRIIRAGGRLYLVPGLWCRYYLKQSDVWSFLRKAFHNAFWTTYPLRYKLRYGLRPRHLAPAAFLLVLTASAAGGLIDPRAPVVAAAALIAYVLVGGAAFAMSSTSASEAVTKFAIAAAFHMTYAVGSWWGLIRAATGRLVPYRPTVSRTA